MRKKVDRRKKRREKRKEAQKEVVPRKCSEKLEKVPVNGNIDQVAMKVAEWAERGVHNGRSQRRVLKDIRITFGRDYGPKIAERVKKNIAFLNS